MKSLFEKAQQFGKSFMLPIAILPAAGLLLGIGGALSNPNTVKAYPILDITLLQNIFTLMSAAVVLFSKIYRSSLQLVSQSDYLEAIKVLQV